MSDIVDRLSAALSDRYRLDRELGAGGMATVYLAHDLKHDRDVAAEVGSPVVACSSRMTMAARCTSSILAPVQDDPSPRPIASCRRC